MKRSILSLVLISSISLAQDIYCPDSVTCSGGTCVPNTQSEKFIAFTHKDGIYYFTSINVPNENYPYFQDPAPTCKYYSLSGTAQDQNTYALYPKKKIFADLQAENNSWINNYDMQWQCGDVTNQINTDPHKCPLIEK